jgi:NAD(P)-dependent dehydrogenase (short-subunit alcohol dehydrogenase family)
MTLKAKKIAVLGGTSGIGLAVAVAAAAEGAKVTVVSSNPDRVRGALEQLPADASGEVLDLADADRLARHFAESEDLDHLVYTAGEALSLARLEDCDLAAARRFWELRYWGALNSAKAAQRRIRAGGSIVFTSGIAGMRPQAGWAVPASICGAMEGLTRALAVELAPVRVNAVAPGVVRTPLWREMEDDVRENFYRDVAAHLPVGHVGEPKQIAAGYIYLMNQGYVTGQTLVIDGGALLA